MVTGVGPEWSTGNWPVIPRLAKRAEGSCVRQVQQFGHGFSGDLTSYLERSAWRNKLAHSWTAEPPFVPSRAVAHDGSIEIALILGSQRKLDFALFA